MRGREKRTKERPDSPPLLSKHPGRLSLPYSVVNYTPFYRIGRARNGRMSPQSLRNDSPVTRLHTTCYRGERTFIQVRDRASWHDFDGNSSPTVDKHRNSLWNPELWDRRDFDASSGFGRAGRSDDRGIGTPQTPAVGLPRA